MCVCAVCSFICSLYVCVFAISLLRALLPELNLMMVMMMMMMMISDCVYFFCISCFHVYVLCFYGP